MRDYAKIYTAIWRSKKFRGLPSDDARLLYLYLHSCQHANMIGCYVLDEGYALSDLSWTQRRFRECMHSLCKAYLVGFDSDESLVRIVGFLRHDPFTNPKHAHGAVKLAEKLPNCVEKQRLMGDLYASKYVNPNMLTDSLSIAYPYQEPEPEPEPEPEQEPEPEPEPDKEESAIALLRETPSRFDEFWAVYPHRGGAKKGRKTSQAKYDAAVKRGIPEQDIIDGAGRYGGDRGVLDGYAKDPTTWLNGAGWQDEIETRGIHENGNRKDSAATASDATNRQIAFAARAARSPSSDCF